MPVTELNHYFVRASNLEATKDFYCKALDLEVMARPPFPFPGYWLGREGRIWVHMGQDGIPNAELYYRGTPKGAAQDNSGVVDHIAFLATDPDDFHKRFAEMKCVSWARALPDFDLFQIFVRDPDGLTIELNFNGLKQMPDYGEDYSKMPELGGSTAKAGTMAKKS
ncbi:MAG: glyoxalase [Betaproteobacteria bacterium]|nr:glyoxalase [Betaproteobacteria bacterium]